MVTYLGFRCVNKGAPPAASGWAFLSSARNSIKSFASIRMQLGESNKLRERKTHTKKTINKKKRNCDNVDISCET